MSLNRTLQSLKIASLFGGIIGLGFGCVIDFGPIEPCESGSNNKLDQNGECECRIGYEWCDPNDQSNLDCCESENADGTGSGDGDGDSGDGDGDSGDGDGDGDGDSGDGDGDGGDGDGDCPPQEYPPESCPPEQENWAWCTNSDPMMPQCGEYFLCLNGVWTESSAVLEENCTFANEDFSYGCWDDGMEVQNECGSGSGVACSDADLAYCLDADQIAYCYWGKETWDSCQRFCEEDGIDMQTFEYGECDDSIPDMVECFCCDQGDPGCPL